MEGEEISPDTDAVVPGNPDQRLAEAEREADVTPVDPARHAYQRQDRTAPLRNYPEPYPRVFPLTTESALTRGYRDALHRAVARERKRRRSAGT